MAKAKKTRKSVPMSVRVRLYMAKNPKATAKQIADAVGTTLSYVYVIKSELNKKKEAEAAVPAEFCELTTLCGPKSYVAERVAAFKEAGVTHLDVHPLPQAGQTNADLIGMVKEMM